MRPAVRIQFEREECLAILRECGASILDETTFEGHPMITRYSLQWPHGTIALCDNKDSATVMAGVFIQLWNAGIDAGDAVRLAYAVC